jgi:hypothetical protein
MLDVVVKRLHAEAGKLDAVTMGYFHSAVLTLLIRLHQSIFIQGQAIATLGAGAATVNFVINNVYRVWRLLGSRWRSHG